MDLQSILQRAKVTSGSDGNTARTCGVTDSAISQWRSGNTAPNNKQCRVLAELSGVPFGVVVACAEAQRAKNDEDAKGWRNTIKKLSATAGTALGALLVAGGMSVAPVKEASATVNINSTAQPQYRLSTKFLSDSISP